jgi:histidinol dehydrogenase
MTLLKRLAATDVQPRPPAAVDEATLGAARTIVEAVREGGATTLRELAEHYGDLQPGAPVLLGRDALLAAWHRIDGHARALLERTRDRISAFATAQRDALATVEVPVPGGRAGHQLAPVARAGCYAPGGRFPLPSSVLMTAVTARVAGVAEVWVASPRPTDMTLAAAHVAGADGLLAVGGAHAIAALAFGVEVPACDVIVGPGNRWVTAAKQLLSGTVAIDMLAGPSELVVLADDSARADLIAADLLAQAEHDPDAVPVLVTTSRTLADAVDAELARQLDDLPTAETARAALGGGFTAVAENLGEAIEAVNRLAPEHLEVMTSNDPEVILRLAHFGGLFIGAHAAEVVGDYGAGPNHVLPTGRTARHGGGLSVFDFIRVRTWIRIDDPAAAAELYADAAALGRHEGLEAHARAADLRHGPKR